MTHQDDTQPDKVDQSFGIIPLRRRGQSATPGTAGGIRGGGDTGGTGRTGGWQVLLVLHRKGHWAFPKGHAEAGESPVQAALRELTEETGLTQVQLLDAPPFIEHYRFTNGKGRLVDKTVTYYLGLVDADHEVTIDQQEILDHRWMDIAQTREQMTFDEGKRLVDAVAKWLEERQ